MACPMAYTLYKIHMCPLVYSNGSIYTQYASSRASTLLAEVVEGALELRTRKVGEDLRRRLVG